MSFYAKFQTSSSKIDRVMLSLVFSIKDYVISILYLNIPPSYFTVQLRLAMWSWRIIFCLKLSLAPLTHFISQKCGYPSLLRPQF